MKLLIAIFLLAVLVSPAEAARRHYKPHRIHYDMHQPTGTVTVSTAAGIPITVSQDFAPKITGFIAANVAAGRHFSSIHCLSFASSHVRGSFHHTGNACDFHPHPIGRLAANYGLRDGCSFSVGRRGHRHPDCEHVDNAIVLARR